MCNNRICRTSWEFSNLKFYDGKLKAHETVINRRLNIPNINVDPIEFIDTAGCALKKFRMPKL